MMTATEMRARAMAVNDKAKKAEQAEAIKWVETVAFAEVEKTANEGMYGVLLEVGNFNKNQKQTIYNHFRKHGFSADMIDNDTLRVKW